MKYSHEENTARQEALYRFLLGRGDKWTSMEQATDSVKEYPAYFRGTYHNSYARRLLTRDIEQMNGSARFEKIIVSGSRGVKLATEREFEGFVRSELREIFKKLKRVRTIMGKGNRNLQQTLEGEIVEAFLF